MKRVEIVLLIDDEFNDGKQSAEEVHDSILRFFTDQIAEQDSEGAWGGLNGTAVYVEQVVRLTVLDL